MAVYTNISAEQAKDFLGKYDLGNYVSHEGIVKGVSNSNFHLFTDRGRYILTLFERRRINYTDLPFFFVFSGHLARKGINCPQARQDKSGTTINELAGRAAVIIDFIEGCDAAKDDITVSHCAQAGELVAQMHKASADFAPERVNAMGIAHWRKLVEKARGYADKFEFGLYRFLAAELAYLEKNWPEGLESGAIHADIFPDNVFFKDGELCAVIDFYFSCTDFYAYDLALALNAWCFEKEKDFSREKFAAMTQAYRETRFLSRPEKTAMQVLCRGAALRILLSRLEEYFEHDGDTLMQPHDPGAYLTRLKFHQENDVTNYL